MARLNRRAAFAVLVVVVGFRSLPARSAETFQPVFTRQYTRTTGAPTNTSDPFIACDPQGTFRIVVQNGADARRVSSGSILVNGLEVIHESDFNQNVQSIERPLTNVASNNRLQVRLASGPSSAIQVSIEGIQSCESVMITSPAAGSVIRQSEIVVQGKVIFDTAANEGVTVNGFPAVVSDDNFAALVTVDDKTTSLTAIITGSRGTVTTNSVPVTVSLPDQELGTTLRGSPAIGLVPQPVSFSFDATLPVGSVALDLEGDGVIEFQGAGLDGQAFTYASPGLFIPTLMVTFADGTTTTLSTIARYYDPAGFDAMLQARWESLKGALRAGDIDAALDNVAGDRRQTYRAMLEGLGANIDNVDAILTDIRLVRTDAPFAEYKMLRVDHGVPISHLVQFVLDDDWVWRLGFF